MKLKFNLEFLLFHFIYPCIATSTDFFSSNNFQSCWKIRRMIIKLIFYLWKFHLIFVFVFPISRHFSIGMRFTTVTWCRAKEAIIPKIEFPSSNRYFDWFPVWLSITLQLEGWREIRFELVSGSIFWLTF